MPSREEQMQAVFLIPCLLTGGTEVATLEMAVALQSLGHAPEVIVYFDEVDPAMLEAFNAAGVVVHLLGVKRGEGVRTQWALARGLLRALRRTRYDAIWLQYMTPTALPLAVTRLFTRNLIATVHVAASHYSPAGRRRLRWLARHWCDRFVCVSHTVAEGIFGPADAAARAGGRIAVIPNALDMAAVRVAAARDWRTEAGWPPETIVLGFTGRLAHIKGVDVLLHSVARLHSQGLPVRLVIVGEGAEQADLEALAVQLGIGAITHFSGRLPRSAIYGAIKGFDIAVVPSREEGFGLSALEAMAAGVPVVASRADALQEVVEEGATGLLCQVDDPQSMADALARLVADAELRTQMGAVGAAHAESLYDAPAYRARLGTLMENLVRPPALAAHRAFRGSEIIGAPRPGAAHDVLDSVPEPTGRPKKQTI